MGETSAIEWCTATWNPVIGCQKVSPACTHCYAETYAAQRLGRPELWRSERHVTGAHTWGMPERVDRKAKRDGVRARLFVASLSDVFEDHPVWNEPPPLGASHAGGTVEVRTAALRKLAALQHTDVLLLTKRPQNVLRMVPREWLPSPPGDERVAWPAHVWVGTTVEDQQRADERLPHLLEVPARMRFVSYEPALGPVDLTPWMEDMGYTCPRCDGPGRDCPKCDGTGKVGDPERISWVIAGGESGPKARPAAANWFRDVRFDCALHGVPFLFKQWGEHDQNGLRVGKKAAGRVLDGKVHDEYPEVSRRVGDPPEVEAP